MHKVLVTLSIYLKISSQLLDSALVFSKARYVF